MFSDDAVVSSPDVTEIVRTLWVNVLAVDSVGLDEDFFENGGHSLLAVALAKQIRQATGVDIYLIDLFKNRTLREQISLIEARRRDSRGPVLRHD